MTNEERIKSLSREQLTRFICGLIYECAIGCDTCKFIRYCDKEHNGVYVWLTNEVKNDD